ncbi:FMN-dependent dehydrogenase family protein [Lophiostoma macrostomum CBS 122681]|uniref:Oxidase FUB9 n=1 Tax=Lophiostoma macrostomum CBS 122681 TaxID=1314788 RepID=A0A6A6TK08_9PLEO|nr:FMN-dependent dehydrogenase family protein [Lophiostoma macrostomum CBS 122681]
MGIKRVRPDPNILTIADLAKEATRRLPKRELEYYNGGAGDTVTLRDNEDAFSRYKLRPRVLRNVDDPDLSTTIFDTEVAFPLGFSPAATHRIAHPDGELATSRAAAANNIPMCLSSWSTESLEAVHEAGRLNPYAMQISFLRNPEFTKSIIKRAEAAGYKALFVNVDLPTIGNRLNEARNNFTFPSHFTFPNLQFLRGDEDAKNPVGTSDVDYDATINWNDTIPWLREQTSMQIWLKGVFTAEDVQLAIEHKVDGVVISNHGGRQLDGVPAALDALRECAPIAKGRIGVAMDGGIRRGSDIFKAIALGADFCFVGRIPLWGLAYKGEQGVDLAIKLLYEEFRSTMMLTGCKTVRDIRRDHLAVLGTNGVLAKL